jgi:serine/threonine protein kinase
MAANERAQETAGPREKQRVVIKRFRGPSSNESKPSDWYYKEKENLEKVCVDSIDRKHLITHIAYCDEGEWLMFPRADGGDLWSHWKGSRPTTAENFLWSVRQIHGLADGLYQLHSVNIRHGDLKPENILYFPEIDGGTLKIADFGISRIHNTETFQRGDGTATCASTRVYEPPEAGSKGEVRRSRRYDCWSMGCIILEFVVWLLRGNPAIVSFRTVRASVEHSYYIQESGSTASERLSDKFEVDPQVCRAICELLNDPRCRGTALGRLVEIVRDDLLRIDYEDRLLAEDLRKKLSDILESVEKKQLALVNWDFTEFVPEKSEIFDQPVRDEKCNSTHYSYNSSKL